MRKIALGLILSLASISTFAQSLTFSKTIHNFGTLYEKDGIVKYPFSFTNNSEKPFVINFISTGCGCSDATYDKSPIMPKQTREIEVTYDPHNRVGMFRTAINIVGATPREDYTLNIIGNIIPEKKTIEDLFPVKIGALLLRDEFIPLGIIPHQEKHNSFIEYYNNSDKEVTIKVRNKETQFAKAWVTKQKIAPNQTGHIMYLVNLENSDYLGDIDDRITIWVDSKEQQTEIIIGGTVIPNFFDYTIEQIELEAVVTVFKPEKSIKTLDGGGSSGFKITNTGSKPLKILKAIPKTKGVKYKIEFEKLDKNESGTIIITIPQSETSDKNTGVVSFITSSPHTPVFTLRLNTEKNKKKNV